MFVVCPKCAAKYQIPPEITLKVGQKIQCSACQHIFNFKFEKVENTNESSVLGIQVPENPVLSETQTVIHEEKVVYTHELPEAFKPLHPIQNKISYAWLWSVVCLGLFLVFVVGLWFYRDVLKVDYTSTNSYVSRSLPRVSNETRSQIEEIVEIPLFEGLDDEVEVSSTVPQSENFRFHSIHFRYEPTGLLIDGMIHNNTNSPQLMPDVVYATAYNHQGQILFQKEIFLPKEILQPYGQKAFFGSYSPAPDGVQWIEVSCEK